MNVAVRDASLVTVRNRNKALSSYNVQFQNATMLSSNPNHTLIAGPAGNSAEVLTQVKLGCIACEQLTNPTTEHPVYMFNPTPCGAASKSGPS
jgi:hypothetical protein